ncbi:MAG: hypothetical protein IJ523_10480 [Succinivibrionaceae bacterium]|nr:hypothetical protein [Succinivibrionaceae bacterium]
MTHDELLEYVIHHPVKAYFRLPWGFKNNISEHLEDFFDDLMVAIRGVGSMFVSLFWVMLCIVAVLVWPAAKAIMLWHLRKRIIKDRHPEMASSPKGEYRI